MPVNVTFGLGQAVDLASRRLVITRMPGAGDDDLPLDPSAANTLGGAITSHVTDLPSNQIFQAVLVDTKTTGEVSTPDF